MYLEGWFSLAADHSGSPMWIIPYDLPTFLLTPFRYSSCPENRTGILYYTYICMYIYIWYLGLDIIRMIFRFLYGQSILTLHLLLKLTFVTSIKLSIHSSQTKEFCFFSMYTWCTLSSTYPLSHVIPLMITFVFFLISQICINLVRINPFLKGVWNK